MTESTQPVDTTADDSSAPDKDMSNDMATSGDSTRSIPSTSDAVSSEPEAAAPKALVSQRARSSWNIDESRDLYGIQRWSHGYFDINDSGDVVVNAPVDGRYATISLMDVVEGLRQRDLDMPVMLRLENLVEERVVTLNQTFGHAIEHCGYQGVYRAVFPIKVNQQKHVIDSIARAGAEFGHGLEAGSKPELLVAIASLPSFESLIVCNGYKDQEFIDLGLQARRLGYKCFFVVETLDELRTIIERSRFWDVQPLIGLRVKLSTRVEGHWANDSGDRSLFGLATVELIKAVDMLRDEGMLDCLQMLHFHLGSQITNIRNVRDGVAEACRYYLDLVADGAPMGYLDIGGGLAVDYDGTESTQPHSRNYDLREYCVDVVETVMNSLDPHGVAHPTLVSESGRWTVAPMSVLLFNILGMTHFSPAPIPATLTDNLSKPVIALLEILENIQERRLQENYNDAVYFRDKLRDAFRTGQINLRQRAFGENVYLTILGQIDSMTDQLRRVPEELVQLRESLSDIYYGNFSVFQSLPDAWAIDQVFPVMPIHRLDERPNRKAIIADLTCDCDGKLDRFTDRNGDPTRTLNVHELREGEPYYIGVFLVGGYQETLGDLHNLFGDTNVASVRVTGDNEMEFVEELHGDSLADVLSYVEYDPQKLFQQFRDKAEDGVRTGTISVAKRQEMLTLFRESLRGVTYFENP